MAETLEGRLLLSGAGFDQSFGAGGKTTIDFSTAGGVRLNAGTATAIQSDGKIFVAGDTVVGGGPDQDFAIARLNVDGSPDTSFGPNGRRTIAFNLGGSNQDTVSAMALQPDGKIVIAGTADVSASDRDFAVARLNTDGTPDTSFGPGGKRTIAFNLGGNNVDEARTVTLQPDGKIVVAGSAEINSTHNQDIAVTRLNADGSLDTSFGQGGKMTIAFALGGNNVDMASAVLIQADGKVVVAGATQTGATNQDFALARLNSDGSLDGSFGSGGQTTIAFNLGGDNADSASALAIQSDGKLFVAGTARVGATDTDFAAVRLNTDGSPDASFGPGGKRTVAFNLGGNNVDTASAMVLQPNGKIVIAGTAQVNSTAQDFALARLNSDGTPDASFGPGGKRAVALNLGGNNIDFANALALLPDGKIVVAGSVVSSAGQDFAVARLLPSSGMTPSDYDGDGKTDLAVYIASSSTFAYQPSSGGPAVVQQFGPAGVGAIPVVGDFDGDGKTDLAVYLPNTSTFVYQRSSDRSVVTQPFGPSGAGAIPAVGDFDGDGKTDIGVYIQSSSIFAYQPSSGGPAFVQRFGPTGVGAIPAIGDYDGDGKSDLAVFLPSPAIFAYQPSTGGAAVVQQFGPGGSSVPAVGDYDGDGKTDLAVYIPSSSIFAYQKSSTGAAVVQQFGPTGNGDIPAVGDFDGDGRTDLTVFIPGPSIFAYQPSSGGAAVVQQFGPGGQSTPARALPSTSQGSTLVVANSAVSSTSTTAPLVAIGARRVSKAPNQSLAVDQALASWNGLS